MAAEATPDAQYALARERMQEIEEQYDFQVIYLGAEVLLDPALGLGGEVPEKLEKNAREAEEELYDLYRKMLKDPDYYARNASMEERSLLYEYFRSVKTWFSSKNSVNGGEEVVEPEKTTGTSKALFLVGRAVVNLKKDEIRRKMGIGN